MKKRDRILHILFLVLRWATGIIFIYAGLSKLMDPKAFARVISEYNIVPEVLLPPLAVGLPVLEVLAGTGVILMIRGSLQVIFSLLLVFVSVLGYALHSNLNVDCGCFSAEEIRGLDSLRVAFYRDLIMIAAVSYIYIYRKLLGQGKLCGVSRLQNKEKEG